MLESRVITDETDNALIDETGTDYILDETTRIPIPTTHRRIGGRNARLLVDFDTT